MDKCSHCGGDFVGNSPTGSWCNRCGWMDPCPCWQKRWCPFHNGHEHKWLIDGRCAVEGCPAKEEYQDKLGV